MPRTTAKCRANKPAGKAQCQSAKADGASGGRGSETAAPAAAAAPADTGERPRLRLEYVRAGDLESNPRNWRLHPPGQMDALKHLLADPGVGWAGALLFNEATGRLIDGHARKAAVGPETLVPVLVGSWDERDERKILASLDPIGAMAGVNADALGALLEDLDFGDGALDALTASLQRSMAEATPDAGEPPESDRGEATGHGEGAGESKGETITCPKCGHRFRSKP